MFVFLGMYLEDHPTTRWYVVNDQWSTSSPNWYYSLSKWSKWMIAYQNRHLGPPEKDPGKRIKHLYTNYQWFMVPCLFFWGCTWRIIPRLGDTWLMTNDQQVHLTGIIPFPSGLNGWSLTRIGIWDPPEKDPGKRIKHLYTNYQWFLVPCLFFFGMYLEEHPTTRWYVVNDQWSTSSPNWYYSLSKWSKWMIAYQNRHLGPPEKDPGKRIKHLYTNYQWFMVPCLFFWGCTWRIIPRLGDTWLMTNDQQVHLTGIIPFPSGLNGWSLTRIGIWDPLKKTLGKGLNIYIQTTNGLWFHVCFFGDVLGGSSHDSVIRG